MPAITGSITDPDFRRRRAQLAARARTSLDYHIRCLVDRWPQLTAEQRDQVAAVLRSSPTDARDVG